MEPAFDIESSLPQQLRMLARVARDVAVGALDAHGLMRSWNEGARRLLGHTTHDTLGQPFSQLFTHEESASGKLERALLAAAQGGVSQISAWHVRKDGSCLRATVTVEALRDQAGELLGYGWVTEGAAERVLGEQFELALEAAPTGMMVIDREGKIVLLNEQVEKLFGYSRAELVGMAVESLVPQRFRGRHPSFRAGFANEPRARPMGAGRDLFGLRKDGEEVPVEIGLNPLRTSQGEYVLSSVVDITERKKSELELELQRASLEQTSREREVLLKEVYHRVKNNLQVISSLLNLQADQLTDDRARALFEDSRNRVFTIALVHEHLYQSNDLSQVDFGEYLHHLLENLRGTVNMPRNVRVIEDLESVRFTVDVAIPCGLIVNELVVNAFKHGFPDGRDGTVHVSLGTLPDGRYRLEVSDTGLGLDPKFEIKQARTLGLELVTKLARQLRGQLELSREHGTRFSLTFGGSS